MAFLKLESHHLQFFGVYLRRLSAFYCHAKSNKLIAMTNIPNINPPMAR